MDESLIDKLIEKAVNLTRKPYKKQEILDILKAGEDDEKPVAIISLDTIDSECEASLLTSHLTGVDGRIREACALKISEFLKNPKTVVFFLNDNTVNTVSDAICDINPNVPRSLEDGIKCSKEFQKILYPKILLKIKTIIEALKALSDTPFLQNKLKDTSNHAKNKLVFNLYWALETLSVFEIDDFLTFEFFDMLKFTSSYIDYTIREKTAKILSKIKNPPSDLLQKLKNDKNFYVKNQLLW